MSAAYDEMRDIDRTLIELADLYRNRGVPACDQAMVRRYMRIRSIVRRMTAAREDILAELYPKAQFLGPEGK